MPRAKEGRKGLPPCVTCLIVCVVVIVVLVVGVIIAANIAFNKFVSPMIGGVKLNECVKLLNGAFHAKRDKIVTDEYTQQDLDDFYTSLNSVLFQKDLTEQELQERYDALSDEEKSKYESFEAYKQANPHRITLSALMSAMSLDDLLNGNSESNNDENVAAAEDGEVLDDNNTAELDSLFKELAFDFSSLKEYPYEGDNEDFNYTTFQITGNQVAALIGEIVKSVLSSINFGDEMSDLNDIDLSSYVGIPQIITTNVEYKDENDQTLNKAKLSITIELKARELIKDAVVPMLESEGVPKFATNIAKSILPKIFFVTLETYPTDNNSEVTIKINNYNEKMCENLKKVVNGLVGNFDISIFPNSDSNEQEQTTTNQEVNLFKDINSMVVDVFSMINDYISIEFVTNEEGSVTLRIAHIQGLLQIAGLFDVDDIENSITPHMFLTTLRCLFDESTAPSNREDLQSLYEQLDQKYGIDIEFWKTHDLLDNETLNSITDTIGISNIEFKDNSQMQVYMHEGQLTTLIQDAIKSGMFNEDSSLAAAEDEVDTSLMDALKIESINIAKVGEENYTAFEYTGKDNVTKTLKNATGKKYTIDLVVSATLSELLSSNSDESSNAMLDSLQSALPSKLCIALVLHILDVYNTDNELVAREIGPKAGDTSIKINKFNEEYSSKVLRMIQLLMTKFTGESDDSFDILSITSQIENGFANVFQSISDNLYCNLEFSERDENNNKKGCLVLPSIYQVVYGFTQNQIANSDDLSQADAISVLEIKDLLVQIYNTEFYVGEYGESSPENADKYEKVLFKYNSEAGDLFLSDLSQKYYMKNSFTVDELFNTDEFDISADTLNFNGENGIYKDTTPIEDLDIPISGDALASIINLSGKMDSLASGELDLAAAKDSSDELIKALSIINCNFEWIDNSLYLNFEFEAQLTNDSSTSNSDDLSLSFFLPKSAYLTAKVIMYSPDEQDLYDTNLLINNSDMTNLAKLIKIFAGSEFSEQDIKEQVKSSISEVFDSVKENINFKYSKNGSALSFKNVFNTINKLSHPDSETDVDKHNDYLAYESLTEAQKEADDKCLRDRLQEFGRQPIFETKQEIDGENTVDIIKFVTDVRYFSNNPSDIYSISDSNEFFEDLNRNYYIAENSKLNADNIQNIYSITSNLINFGDIYLDTRPIDQMQIWLTSNRFTALANKFIKNIEIGDNDDQEIGYAKIIQSRILVENDNPFIEMVVYVDLSSQEDDIANIMPSHLFISSRIDLSVNPLTGNKDYETIVYVNDLTEQETEDLFDRIKLLERAFDIDLGLSIDELKSTMSDEIKKLFDNDFNMFGELRIKNGYIDIPNLFEYITNGSIEHGEYNSNKPMFETCALSSTKGTYKVVDGLVCYEDNDNTINVKVYQSGEWIDAQAIKQDELWGYMDNGNFVVIQTKPQDLMYNLRAFGNKPVEYKANIVAGESQLGYQKLGYDNNTSIVTSTATSNITVYGTIGIHLQDSNDGFYVLDTANGFFKDNQAEFFDLVNTNYYITNEDKKLSAENISNPEKPMIIDNEMFDFNDLYNDNRAYEDTLIKVKGNTFAALSKEFYKEGIQLSDDNVAEVVQMHFFTKDKSENYENLLGDGEKYSTLRTIIRVALSSTGNQSNILPEYIYMVCYTIIDPDAGEQKYNSEFVINDFGYKFVDKNSYAGIQGQFEETENFINRLNVLKSTFNMSFKFDAEDIKDKLKETFRKIFDENMSSFGKIDFEDDSILIPNIFQYMTDGQLVGSGSLVYDNTIKMKDADGTNTDPKELRKRFQELGKGELYTNEIGVWYDDGRYYNDNMYGENSLDDFYSDMQAYYFMANKPTKDMFNTGSSSVFTELNGDNFSTIFNLTGQSAVVPNSTRNSYIHYGLYNYSGEQVNLRLSDKALGALINEQSAIETNAEMTVESLSVTSVKLTINEDSNLNIEITIRVIPKQSGMNSMPSVFYLTTLTTRTVGVDDINYNTQVAVNAFRPVDLDNFLANLSHIEKDSSMGISSHFNTEKIAEAVQSAIATMLDEKLPDYTSGFGKYDDEDNSGVGYIQFKNIYSEILNKTPAQGTENEVTLQRLIVKLHNPNEYLDHNPYSDVTVNAIDFLFGKTHITDKEMAYLLSESLGSSMTINQVVILKDYSQNLDGFVQIISGFINNDNDQFELSSTGNGYYLITASVDISTIGCNVSLLPSILYVTILLDSEGQFVTFVGKDGSTQSVKFIQDLTFDEQALLFDIIEQHNELDVEDEIQTQLNNIRTFISDTTLSQNTDTDFVDYYGYVGTL